MSLPDSGMAFGPAMAPNAVGAPPIGLAVARGARGEPGNRSALPCWRLKRVADFVEAHLGEPVGLPDMATAAGLTRMYFAAQFRAATGLRPHDYLLRRRIERAQALLVQTGKPTVEVALAVGFQTQAHFTSVFKNIVGQPPRAWRLAQGGPSSRYIVSNLAD